MDPLSEEQLDKGAKVLFEDHVRWGRVPYEKQNPAAKRQYRELARAVYDAMISDGSVHHGV